MQEVEEADAIGTIDRFALQYRLPDGKTVVDRFVASRPDLDAADREMLLGWRDPVEGIFEIRSKAGEAIILLNLLDDLKYRTYSNMGRAAFRPLPKGGFVHARLAPIRPVSGVWLVSGRMSLVLPARAPSGRHRDRRPPARARLRRSWVKGAKARWPERVVRDNGRLWTCTATNGCARARR